MSRFGAIEDTIIERARNVLGQHVRTVEPHPGAWTDDELRRRLRLAPAVYLAFNVARLMRDAHEVFISSEWLLYVMTADVGTEAARRRGRSGQMGAWDILEAVLPAVHGLTVDDVGTVELGAVRNLYSGPLDKSGLALYAATLSVPLTLSAPDVAALDDFATFDAQMDIPPHEDAAEHAKWLEEPPDHTTSTPDAHDTVTGLDT